MRLIYDNNGVASVLVPAPKFLAQLTGTLEEKLIHIANKNLPTGTKYEIIADSVDLSDRTFRGAWEYTANAAVEKTSADLTDSELKNYDMTENI
jgi:hypothetical protein|tara:strand:- start:74 stop:355 length:282 start_codon:yes stop_codon:yes gene_type:complete